MASNPNRKEKETHYRDNSSHFLPCKIYKLPIFSFFLLEERIRTPTLLKMLLSFRWCLALQFPPDCSLLYPQPLAFHWFHLTSMRTFSISLSINKKNLSGCTFHSSDYLFFLIHFLTSHLLLSLVCFPSHHSIMSLYTKISRALLLL